MAFLMVDNYDSFTYNLVQYFWELGVEMEVFRNDRISLSEVESGGYEAIVLSPGPGTPADSGICPQIVRELGTRLPILGVCLGHQTIGEVFGGTVARAPRLMHGKTSPVFHDGSELFEGIPSPFEATRYHSLIVLESSLPEEIRCFFRESRASVREVRIFTRCLPSPEACARESSGRFPGAWRPVTYSPGSSQRPF